MNTIAKIKITSGSNTKAAKEIDDLYSSIISAELADFFIKIAEAAKVIENSQRDLNIAFVNSCQSFLIDWKLIPRCWKRQGEMEFFTIRPGMVGGHCIDCRSLLLNS